MFNFIRLFLFLFISIIFSISHSANIDSRRNGIDLKIGESTLINQNSASEFLTSIRAQYRLTRITEEKYTSEIAVEFYTKDLKITKKDLFEFKSRVQKCLGRTSDLLNGPNNKNLQILLAKDNSTFPADAIISIEVSKEITRENARHYSLSSDCATLTHEILHLHGLVDEYPENFSTDQFKILSCRHPGAPTSIMYNPQVAFERAQLKYMDIWNYEMRRSDGTIIQNEVTVKKGTILPIEGMKKLGATNIEMIGSAVRNSLLSAQQFNVIVNPGQVANRLYYTCAANSARLIFPEGSTVNGVPVERGMACIQTPDACLAPDIWAGSPEKLYYF